MIFTLLLLYQEFFIIQLFTRLEARGGLEEAKDVLKEGMDELEEGMDGLEEAKVTY